MVAPADERLDLLWRACVRAWPTIALDRARYVAHLDARLQPAEIGALTPERAADLYLACACAQAIPGAATCFRDHFTPLLRAHLRDSDASGIDAADLLQLVLSHVLVAEHDGAARIDAYGGRGSLAGWLRVVARRIAHNARRNRSDHADALPQRFEDRLADELDPELDYLKAHYRAAFRVALATVLAELSARERTLLRMQVVDGLSATGVATIFRVHRATAKRWLAEVRERVLSGTRARLMGELGVDLRELDSIMRMIESNLAVSVRRHLGETQA